MTKMLVFRHRTWLFVVVAVFTIVYTQSLLIISFEGDAASSVAYHALGRDLMLQEPYKPYHSMMDRVLSILPAQESLVRAIAFVASAVATVTTTILLIALLFDWYPSWKDRGGRWWYIGMLLVVSPELYYLGLGYSPTMIAMTCILGSHLLLRQTQFFQPGVKSQKISRLYTLLSLTLFAVGVGFRWSTLSYGLVITADMFFNSPAQSSKQGRKVLEVIAWGVIALLFTTIVIFSSNISQNSLAVTFGAMQEVSVENQVVDQISFGFTLNAETFATLFSLVTPAFGILGLVGFIRLIRQRSPLVFIILVSILSVLPWIPSGTPKFIIVAVPAMMLSVLVGFDALWHLSSSISRMLRLVIIVTLLLPWFVGLRIALADSAWGPGFELQPFNRTEDIETIGIVIGPGAALPTPESIRPIGGHFYVLLGGQWRVWQRQQHEERVNLLVAALEQEIPILVLAWSPDFFTTNLVRMGFETVDSQSRPLPRDTAFVERRFTRDTEQITIIYQEIVGEIEPDELQDILSLSDLSNKFAVFGSPSTLRSLYNYMPVALEARGSKVGILDVSLLASANP